MRDRDGRLVSDLAPENFRVLEDGRPQAVVVFGRAVDSPGYRCPIHRDVRESRPGNCVRCGATLVPDRDDLTVDLGLLFDTSESMIDQLKLSQEAAVRFLEAVPRARDLITIFFDQDIRISRYDSENQQGLFDRIREAKGGGNTALYDAIAVYLSRVEDSTGRKVLVVFTDGEDSTSGLGLPELIRLVQSSSVTIYPIAFMGGFPAAGSRALLPRAFLLRLAELTGGRVFSPTTSRDLPGIYARILDELSSQYVIGYTSDNPRRDGKYRKLRVEVQREGLKVRHRAGYQAPGGY